MAACNFRASPHGRINSSLGAWRPQFGALPQSQRLKSKKCIPAGLATSHESKKAFVPSQCSGNESESTASINVESDSKESTSSDSETQRIPSAKQVESLLTELCDTTSIAEFEIKAGGFRLYVMRDLSAQKHGKAPNPSPTPVKETSDTVLPNASALASLALTKSLYSSAAIETSLATIPDESLVFIKSPKVGTFGRCRKFRGRKLPPSCKEKAKVQEGQVLCFIEQVGCQFPVQSDVSGEIVKILLKDGDPVGYDDPLIAILPSFPGIKKLQ